jgi:hypothetical protein
MRNPGTLEDRCRRCSADSGIHAFRGIPCPGYGGTASAESLELP